MSHRIGILVAALVAFGLTSCDGKPVADRPQPEPGFKDGETPPPDPRGGTTPLPPATTPATPVEPNHPSAPLPPQPEPVRPTTAVPPVPAPAASAAASGSTPPAADAVHAPPLDTGALVSTPPPPAVTSAVQGLDDEVITAHAYRALALQSGLSSDGKVVTIATVGGKVMLRGSVADEEERQRILATIGRIDGVRAIEDLLDVQRQ